MRWPRDSTRRAASRPSPRPISGTRGTVIFRWGALGKVRQLDELYPHIREDKLLPLTATIGTPVEQLDVETVVKASQAVSGEIVLASLIETLMRSPSSMPVPSEACSFFSGATSRRLRRRPRPAAAGSK